MPLTILPQGLKFTGAAFSSCGTEQLSDIAWTEPIAARASPSVAMAALSVATVSDANAKAVIMKVANSFMDLHISHASPACEGREKRGAASLPIYRTVMAPVPSIPPPGPE